MFGEVSLGYFSEKKTSNEIAIHMFGSKVYLAHKVFFQ